MSAFEQGFYMAAGFLAFFGFAFVVLQVWAFLANLFMDIFGYRSNLPWHRSYTRMPEAQACEDCGWKPAIFIPHTTIVHLPDGTHDAKTKENY